MLPAAKGFKNCICSALCDGSDSAMCKQESEPQEPDLQNWLRTTCRISSGTKELAVALRGLGVDTQDDLRFVKEATVDALLGIPEVRRQRLKQCIRNFEDREL